MPLEEYKNKRRFDKTPEPTGGAGHDEKLHFVVQKHAASHLHYDFRLEIKGVLKSWAVPKGPSMNPDEKRLAMLTEDHPYDYKNFEGIIPKAQYGGGTVIIWDEGTYDTPEVDANDKKAQEHTLMGDFYKGGLLFTLHGKKLKGQFALIKVPERDEKSWYLLKVKDKYATTADITTKDKSVISGLTIEDMTTNPAAKKWQSNRKAKEAEPPKEQDKSYEALLKKATKEPMPDAVSPMNCTLIKEIFTGENWLFEVKLDGYRIVSFVSNGKARLQSRGGLNYTSKYPAIVEGLKQVLFKCVLDGEVVALDEEGKISFDQLQKTGSKTNLVYYVFDVLWLDGYNLKKLPLEERKAILRQILPDSDTIRYSDDFEDGAGLWQQAQEMELEGIVAKRKDSIYQENFRSQDWLKLPTKKRQEFVIGGWAESERGRSFRSLLFGAYNSKGELEWIGRSGGGYKEKDMPGILKQLKALETKDSPFVNKILDTKGAIIHYVKPQLVANFEFATWTTSGRIRKPATFLGFRNDKKATEVVREKPLTEEQEATITGEAPQKAEKAKPVKPTASTGKVTMETSNWPVIENEEITSEEVFNIEGKEVRLTNIEREIWAGVPKATLIQYYHAVAPYILPHLKDRALSLHIKNINAGAPGIYIKDMEGRQPEWATLFTTPRKNPKKGKRDIIDYLVCNNEATLLYCVNLGCIDFNPWTSRMQNYYYPDYINIDLDPSDDDFEKAITTALAAKQYFDENKLKSFVKTSGKTGIHLYLPCEGFTFPEAKKIADHMCSEIHQLAPGMTTVAFSKSQRGTKLYVDSNQNVEAHTLACAYSARPFHTPTVSTPLDWKEVKPGLNQHDYDIHTILPRIEKKGDLFEKVADKKTMVANAKILKQFL
jgi:bifunctional non-homologous end joining protein LigD